MKAHKMDGAATREVCEVARAFRLPVLYDVVGKTDIIDLLAPEYPDVNFIIPHLGSFADDWRAHVRVIDQISRLHNVYTDTAGVRRFDYLVQAIERGGAHKVLFGCDGPWLHSALELQKIRLLKLSPQDEALVLGKNLLRLIKGVGKSQQQHTGQKHKERSSLRDGRKVRYAKGVSCSARSAYASKIIA
jgi:uncharacterized protein